MSVPVIEIVAMAQANLADLAMPRPDEKAAQRLMSRSALLAYQATRAVLADSGWQPADLAAAGLFMGVGASGSDVGQLQRILVASFVDGHFAATQFGDRGLRACNPLFAFQLMNNFVMANTAMLIGTQGPNAVLFSRGAGTTLALDEAIAALREGECTLALVGGADCATHPVTELENRYASKFRSAYEPREGAAMFALQRVAAPTGRWRIVDLQCSTHVWPQPPLHIVLGVRPNANVYVDGWCSDAVRDVAAALTEVTPAIAVGTGHDTLAAGPALSWMAALQAAPANVVQLAVVHIDINGDMTAVHFARGAA
jgi:hypothetical protein